MHEPNEESSVITNLGFEELKRIYDNEAERKRNLDSKSATVLGFASLIVTLLLFILKYFLDNPTNMSGIYILGISISKIYILGISISMAVLAISLILLIIAFQIRNYEAPVKYNKAKTLYLYLTIHPEEEFRKKMLKRYINCIRINYGKNQIKAISLKMATILLVTGMLIALISPIIILWVYWGF